MGIRNQDALSTVSKFVSDPIGSTVGAFVGAVTRPAKPFELRSLSEVRRLTRSPRFRQTHGAPTNAPEGYSTPQSDYINFIGALANHLPGNPRTPLPQAVNLSGISILEMAEIDAAIKSGKAVPVRPVGGRQLLDAAVDVYTRGEAAKPTYHTPPPPILPQPRIGTVARPPEPNLASAKSAVGPPEEPAPMNLSNILSGVTSVAETAAGLASTYYQLRNVRAGVPQAPAAPPAVNPVRQPAGVAIPSVQAPTNRIFRDSGLPQATGTNPYAQQTLLGPAISLGARAMATGWGKAAAIAAATGLGIEAVDAVLSHPGARPKRRRRRMLTKSDVADISTMAALLGKNSESFKTWLAGSLRR